MMKIKEFNRQNIKDIRKAIEAALKSVSNEMGFTIELGNNITFSSTSINGRITAAISAHGESPSMVKYREDLIRYSYLTGVKEEHIGASINISKGRTGKLIGYSVKSQKYPFIVELPDGSLIKCMAASIKQQLKISDRPIGGLTRVPAPTSFTKTPDNKGGLIITPASNATIPLEKPSLNINESVVYQYIISTLSVTKKTSCTMNEVLEFAKKSGQFKDASVMVFVGNLSKKCYIRRDSAKNIYVTL